MDVRGGTVSAAATCFSADKRAPDVIRLILLVRNRRGGPVEGSLRPVFCGQS